MSNDTVGTGGDRFFRNQQQIEESVELAVERLLAGLDDGDTLKSLTADDLEGVVLGVLSKVADFIEGESSSVIPDIRKTLETAAEIVLHEGDSQQEAGA